MWYGVDSITGIAGAAILCTLAAQFLASRESEVGSEVVCWILLPVLFVLWEVRWANNRFQRADYGSLASRKSLWVVAAGIAVACLHRAELGRQGLFPILTTLVLIAEKYLRPELLATKSSKSWILSSFINTILGTIIAAAFTIFALSNWDIQDYALSLIPTVAMLAVYIAMIPSKIGVCFLPFVNIEAANHLVGVRVLIILTVAFGIQTYLFGLPEDGITHLMLLGLAKALSWFFTIKTIHYPAFTSKNFEGMSTTPQNRHASWCIATVISTFSIVSSIDISMQTSEAKAVSQVIASFLALAQLVYLLPKQAKARHTLWILALFSIIPYLANVHTIRNSRSNSNKNWEHPVEALVRHAKADFDRRMNSQSRTYAEAHDEYTRRYKVEPRPGFKAWYEYAVANESPIIDDFDMINEMISPFRKLSGKEVLENMRSVEGRDLWTCTFSHDTSATNCTHPWRSFDRHIESLFNDLLGETHGILPDVKFLVNHLDEPRVIIPPNFPSKDSPHTGYMLTTEISKEPSWDEITKFCSLQNSTYKSTQPSIKTYNLPFITNRTAAIDLCQHPEYSSLHGLFISPTSLNLIEDLYPILSTGTLSTMGDILFPSPAYLEPDFTYNAAHDIPWSRKTNNLYWAGSTTGGHATNPNWRFFQRQRFVSIAQNLHRNNSYLHLDGGSVVKETSKWLNGRLYNVFFTRIFQCRLPLCHSQRLHFLTRSRVPSNAALSSKLTFDIDGNGISGRFYSLLASNSLPLKQTIFREWHDERLVAWVHYIPVSLSMDELPELVRFLTQEEKGRKIAKAIAGGGKEWFGRAFRRRDFGVYVLRLLLEVARLQDLERVGER